MLYSNETTKIINIFTYKQNSYQLFTPALSDPLITLKACAIVIYLGLPRVLIYI